METVSFKKGDKIQREGKVYEFVKYDKCEYQNGRAFCSTCSECPGAIKTEPYSGMCGWSGEKCTYTLVEKKEEKMKTTFEHKFKVGDKVRAVLSKLIGEISGLDYCALATESKVAYHVKNRLGETRTMVEYQLELVPELTGQDIYNTIIRDFYDFHSNNINNKDVVLYIKKHNWDKVARHLRYEPMYSLYNSTNRTFMGQKVFLVDDEDAPEWRWA